MCVHSGSKKPTMEMCNSKRFGFVRKTIQPTLLQCICVQVNSFYNELDYFLKMKITGLGSETFQLLQFI